MAGFQTGRHCFPKPAMLVLLAACTFLIPFLFPPVPANAASVTVPITISVYETGAPSFTWTIGGLCSPSPSSGVTGVTVTVTMDPSCTYIINTPPDTATQRDRLTNASNGYVPRLSETSCSSGACSAITDTAHVEELLIVSTSCNSPYFNQVSPTGDTWYNYGTALTVTCKGAWARVSGTGIRAVSWSWDTGASTAVATISTFTSSSQTMTAGHTLNVNTVTQYQLNLDSEAAQALSSLTPNSIPGDSYWYDSGVSVTYVGNGVFQRTFGAGSRSTSWSVDSGSATTLSTDGTFTISSIMSATHTIHVTVHEQYQLTLSSSAVSVLNSITSPSVPGDNYWYDAGTQVTYTGNGVYARSAGTGDRVSGWSVDSNPTTPVLTASTFSAGILMAAAHALYLTSVTQFQVAFTGQYGVSSATSPTIPGDNYWYDSGTHVSLSLLGVFSRASGSGERTVSYAVNSGQSTQVATTGPVPALNSVLLTAPITVSVQSVIQYQLALDQTTTRALISVTPPTLSGDDYWYDAGSKITLTLMGTWARNATSGFRLASYSVNGAVPTMVATSGATSINLEQAVFPQSVTSTTATQFLLRVIGGAGVSYSTGPPISGDTGWYDSGTVLSVSTRGTFDSNGSTRQRVSSWSADGGPSVQASITDIVTTSPITMNSTHIIIFNSVTQYNVLVTVKDYTGALTLTSPAILVSVNGATQSIVQGAVWVDNGGSLRVTAISWEGVDVTPNQTSSYTVGSPFSITLNARVFEAKVAVKDLVGLPVGGATYTITFANMTVVHGSTPGDGVINLGAISLGTFQGSASYLGATVYFSGDAASNPTTNVIVPLSYSLIAILVAAIAVVVVVLVIMRRRRVERPEGLEVYKPSLTVGI